MSSRHRRDAREAEQSPGKGTGKGFVMSADILNARALLSGELGAVGVPCLFRPGAGGGSESDPERLNPRAGTSFPAPWARRRAGKREHERWGFKRWSWKSGRHPIP